MVYEALAKGMPDRIPASSGSDLGAVMFWGERPEREESFMMVAIMAISSMTAVATRAVS